MLPPPITLRPRGGERDARDARASRGDLPRETQRSSRHVPHLTGSLLVAARSFPRQGQGPGDRARAHTGTRDHRQRDRPPPSSSCAHGGRCVCAARDARLPPGAPGIRAKQRDTARTLLTGGKFPSCSPLEFQGMLHLYRLYCAKGRCARCPVTAGPAPRRQAEQRIHARGVRMSHRPSQARTSMSQRR